MLIRAFGDNGEIHDIICQSIEVSINGDLIADMGGAYGYVTVPIKQVVRIAEQKKGFSPTLLEYLKMIDDDTVDVYDDTYDEDGTAFCYFTGSYDGWSKKPEDDYERVLKYIAENTEVVRKYGDCGVIVDWVKFIKKHWEVFTALLNEEEWKYKLTGDEDDDMCVCIATINGIIAGYVPEETNTRFMELVEKEK